MAGNKRTRNESSISPIAWAFLHDEPPSSGGSLLWRLQHDVGGAARDLWAQHSRAVLDGWIKAHPGTRPLLWWVYDAPRDPAGAPRGAMPDEIPAEPRRRLGGTGQPMHEVSATVARYAFGLPVDWLSPELARHVPGIAIDPNDLPRFETQAAYLERHGLLTAGERRALAKRPAPDFEALENGHE